MPGVKGRSGRKRSVLNALHYFNQLYDQNSYKLAEVTIQKALKGDREMLIYCHDRRLGKPKIHTEIEIEGAEKLGTGLIVGMYEQMERVHRESLEHKLLE